jgi:hypothetical protein
VTVCGILGCDVVESCRYILKFRGTYSIRLQISIALKMEAIRSSKTRILGVITE